MSGVVAGLQAHIQPTGIRTLGSMARDGGLFVIEREGILSIVKVQREAKTGLHRIGSLDWATPHRPGEQVENVIARLEINY